MNLNHIAKKPFFDLFYSKPIMLSVSDLIQLGGYAAVEYCGGPSMVFRMGREDVHGEADVVHHEPETFYNSLNISRLSRMNLPAEDFVALVGGT